MSEAAENNLLEEMLKKRQALWEQFELEKMKLRGVEPKDNKWKSKYKEPVKIGVNNLSKIPMNWIWASVSQIGFVISGQTPKGIADIKESDGTPWFKVGDMNTEGNEQNISKAETYLTSDQLRELKLNVQPEGTVIFPKRGGAILTNKKRMLAQPSAYDLNTMGVYPVGVERKYLWYWFQSINLGALSDGSNVPQINHGDIEPLPIPVAPPEQQKRIVAKIEELFSHIDAGIEALKKAKQLLKQYRQSVLKAAVTGELTKEWREANKDKLEPASQLLVCILKERCQKWEEQQLKQFKAKGKMPKDDKWKEKYKEPHTAEYEGDMPEGWVAVTASQLAEHIVDGTHHTPKYIDEGIDFVSAKNINDWEIDYLDTKKISKEEHEELIKRCHPKKGDVLLTKSGTLGRAAVVKDDHVFSVFESVAVFPILDKSISDYIVLAIHEAAMGDAGRKIQKGIAVKHLHLEDLRKMEFLLPPEREIKEIVRVFENVTSASFRLEKELEVKLLQADRNKQSVLASAFAGKLQ
jgi:type I restriction enzyme, S subunit